MNIEIEFSCTNIIYLIRYTRIPLKYLFNGKSTLASNEINVLVCDIK